jgi:hypothetical protein
MTRIAGITKQPSALRGASGRGSSSSSPRRCSGDFRSSACEHTFVPPYPVIRARFDGAIARRDLAGVREAARAFPNGLQLADALAVLVLMEDLEDPAFERAAVRWVARFASECADAGLADLSAAVDALDGLPAHGARAVLAALLTRVR